MSSIWETKKGKVWEHSRDGCPVYGQGPTKTAARADWACKMVDAYHTADHAPIVIRYGDYLGIIYGSPAGIWTNIVELGHTKLDDRDTVTRYNFRALGGSVHGLSDLEHAERQIRLNLAWRNYDPAVDLAQLDDTIPAVIENEDDRAEYVKMRDWQRLAQTFKRWAEGEGQRREVGNVDPAYISQYCHAYACAEEYRPIDKRLTPDEWYTMQARGLT